MTRKPIARLDDEELETEIESLKNRMDERAATHQLVSTEDSLRLRRLQEERRCRRD